MAGARPRSGGKGLPGRQVHRTKAWPMGTHWGAQPAVTNAGACRTPGLDRRG